ncbi:MAG: ATP-binding protein [Candidatus Methylomirabilia bacterium]
MGFGQVVKGWRLFSRILSLREASAIIFTLTTILPLLVVLAFLSRSALMVSTGAQAALLVALLIGVLGFVLLQRMAARISRLAQAVEGSKPPERSEGIPKVDTATVPGVGSLAEIGQISEAFNRLFENVRESTERLEDLVFKLGALNEMVELAASIPKMQDLLALVLERTMRVVKATAGSIMLLDQERQMLRIAAARGLPDDATARGEVRLGEGIAGQVAQFGEPVVVDDVERDPRFAGANDPRCASGSFICVPVRVADRVIGVINLAKTADRPGRSAPARAVSATDLQLLNALVTYIGYAVDNARLLEKTQESAQQLQKALDELKATQAQLVRGETLRAIGELASRMAHHIHNLMAVVVGRVRILQDKLHEPDVRRALQIVERSALDGTEMVRRLNRFSRGQPVSHGVPVDLNTIVEEVLELIQPLWRDRTQVRRIPIETRLDPGRIPAVTGDLVSLREALMNLVLNAVDALPEGGTITIRTWASDGQVHCSVADTGPGMSEEVRRRALEPFFTTKGPKTTGLGLSVAYGIIKHHGGELTIESAEGRGTTVTIRLAAAAPSDLHDNLPGLHTHSEAPDRTS